MRNFNVSILFQLLAKQNNCHLKKKNDKFFEQKKLQKGCNIIFKSVNCYFKEQIPFVIKVRKKRRKKNLLKNRYPEDHLPIKAFFLFLCLSGFRHLHLLTLSNEDL